MLTLVSDVFLLVILVGIIGASLYRSYRDNAPSLYLISVGAVWLAIHYGLDVFGISHQFEDKVFRPAMIIFSLGLFVFLLRRELTDWVGRLYRRAKHNT